MSIDSIDITEEVFNTLSSLKRPAGIDGISPAIFKHCAIVLTKPLQYSFSQSIWHYSLPAEWKIHCITPIFKSGNKNSVTNYRPISLLCIISKVLERLIYNKVIACIYTSISTHQFGFMKGYSTLQQLLIFLNSIHEHSKAQTDVIYLDFAKAFDRVPHNELLLKLWRIGITVDLWWWFKSYLNYRLLS